MSVRLSLVNHQGLPLDAPQQVALVLYGDERPLARGVPEPGGIVRFDASIAGIKRLTVRAEWLQPRG